MPELLAPAGDRICLNAAIDAGCDAVYFGVGELNMRAGATNFAVAEVPEIVSLCRERGVRAYLTLNSLVYEEELDLAGQLVGQASDAGVDAVIASDFSVISAAHAAGMDIHISTQMSVANTDSIAFFHRTFGVRRFVLARECTLAQIVSMRSHLAERMGDEADQIELEAFVHGAMCVSLSGRCLLSHFQYGASGNRGECLQPCRREYRITNVEEDEAFVVGEDYVLSPKDLCALPFIEQLIDAGIASFKIEGRNRSPEYVSVVTKAYRRAIDYHAVHSNKPDFPEQFSDLKNELMESVGTVYNRGFSNGFYFGQPMKAWGRSNSAATTRKFYSGLVVNYYRKPGVAEVMVHDREFVRGDTIMFQGPTTGVVTQTADSIEIEHAPVEQATKGACIAVKTVSPVRRQDKVFVVVPAQ